MRRRVLVELVLGLALLAPRAGAGSPLEARLDAALASRGLRGARIAALVVARDDGRTLYARDPDRPLVPASNLKILTAVAALAAFGPTHRFTTELFADAAPDAEGAIDVLAVRGGGDPALTSEHLWRLAADLRRAGLRRVRKGLLLDDSAFDAERWNPSWGAISARAYHAPVGALTANYGAFAVWVEPGERVGDPVRVEVDPPAALFRLTNRATTGPARARSSLAVEREAAGALQHVIVSGAAPAGSPTRVYYRGVLDPARYAGAVLRMQLEANGIAVEGETRVGEVPEAAVPLLAFEGDSLAEIVRLFLKFSNNAIAESLLKAMGAKANGRPGSWESGIPAMRAQLAGLGLDTDSLTFVDASGLSYANRVAPRTLVDALLLAHRSFRFGPEFTAALPIAAADGTLAERAEGAAHAARAKTGLLTRVTGLSGYSQLRDGTDVVFSVLANGYRGSDEEAMASLDRFTSELVSAPVSVAEPGQEARSREASP